MYVIRASSYKDSGIPGFDDLTFSRSRPSEVCGKNDPVRGQPLHFDTRIYCAIHKDYVLSISTLPYIFATKYY
jgi:hypothetical protein